MYLDLVYFYQKFNSTGLILSSFSKTLYTARNNLIVFMVEDMTVSVRKNTNISEIDKLITPLTLLRSPEFFISCCISLLIRLE
jgi:hypothetical protein